MRMHWLQFETHVLSLYAFACFLPRNSVVIFKVYPKIMKTLTWKIWPKILSNNYIQISKNFMISPCFQIVNSPPFAAVWGVPAGTHRWGHPRASSLAHMARHVETTGASWSGSVPTQMFTEKTVPLEKKHQKITKKQKPPETRFLQQRNPIRPKWRKSSNIEAGKWWFVPTQSGIQPWPAAFWDWTNMGFHQGLSSAHYMTNWGLLKNHPWNSAYTDVCRIINFNWGWLVLFSVYPTRISCELFGIPATFTLPPSSRLSWCFSWPPLQTRSMASMVLS